MFLFFYFFLCLPLFLMPTIILRYILCAPQIFIYMYVYKEQIEKGGFYVSLCIGRLALLLSQANGH